MPLLTEPASPTLYAASPAMPCTGFTVRSCDVALAARAWGDPNRPTVILVHGYPDSSEVWDALAALLANDFHVVAYDVRGAGQSTAPKGTAAYCLEKLTDDFIAVIDTVSPHRAVHLVAHDWGSIQGWEFVTEERLRGRIASYTSCSGPCLDHVAYWMRARLRHPTPRSIGKLAGQLVRSWYVLLFHLPVLPALIWRLWLGRAWPRVLLRVEKTRIAPRPTQTQDGVRGVSLYRANFIRCLFTPRQRYAHAPVQVIVPTLDKYVSPALSEDLSRWVPKYWRRELAERHWVPLTHPEQMAQMVRELVDYAEGAEGGAQPDTTSPTGRRRPS
ncbi:alpha/beta hydrolase [Paraburkholderia lacunae]|uniref:Alpha/beta hydrolase n=1 Tax=Paraburkholderia lacunae TaxID=2211104 RepID=A0A370N5N4_9BURK|nr:alpha/beta hydrolase [Paraburkholderia lacunae]